MNLIINFMILMSKNLNRLLIMMKIVILMIYYNINNNIFKI